MLKDGEYAAWYKTPAGDGTGTLCLKDGVIEGRDLFFLWSGTYRQDADKFLAVVRTKKHTEGQSTLFGVDEVELILEGRSTDTMASCIGFAKERPEIKFEATLIKLDDAAHQHPSPTVEPPKFDLSKLPKPRSR